MSSFFTEFLDKFNEIKTEQGLPLGGRYVAFILQEVIAEYPELLKSINKNFCQRIQLGRNRLTIETEKKFPSSSGEKQQRRADMYFFEEVSGKELFVEIKWKDSHSDEEQMPDYLKEIETNPNKKFFSFLTLQGKPDVSEILKNKNNAQYVLFSNLLKECRSLYNYNLAKPKKDTGLMILFIKFLEEHTMRYSTEINKKALLTLMKSSIGMPHASGGGKVAEQAHIENIPELWKHLLGNLKVLGERFHVDFYQKTGIFGNTPFPQFRFISLLPNIETIRRTYKKLELDDEKQLTLGTWDDIKVDEGGVDFWNHVIIQKKQYVNFGFQFWNVERSVTFSIFAGFVESQGDYSDTITLKSRKIKNDSMIILPDEETVYRGMLSILKTQIEKWLKGKQTNKDKELVESFKSFYSVLKENV